MAELLAKPLRGVMIRAAHIDSRTLSTAGLAKLVRLPEMHELQMVWLKNDVLDDGVFAELATLPNLIGLETAGCSKVTGKGVHALKACPKLDGLTLSVCPLTPEVIEELQQLPVLAHLNIDGVPCTARHVAALVPLKLKLLLIANTGIDDAMAARLAEMETLEELTLTANPLTDKAVADLKRLRRLRKLNLVGTQMTAAGVAELRQALPMCRIEWEAK